MRIGSVPRLPRLKSHTFLVLSTVCLLLGFPASGRRQYGNTVHLYDNSDWWSINRGTDSGEDLPVQKGELLPGTLRILGITLDENVFAQTEPKLGKAALIERGDASTGRQQACYKSAGTPADVYLVFERAEIGATFYLFVGGPTWEGADRCVESKAISNRLATASGVRLGMTPSQLVAILGKPTKRDGNRLVYSFLTRKKTDPKDLTEARRHNPGMSEKDFHANYDYYDLGTGVDATFTNSKLTYLAVSKVESN